MRVLSETPCGSVGSIVFETRALAGTCQGGNPERYEAGRSTTMTAVGAI